MKKDKLPPFESHLFPGPSQPVKDKLPPLSSTVEVGSAIVEFVRK